VEGSLRGPIGKGKRKREDRMYAKKKKRPRSTSEGGLSCATVGTKTNAVSQLKPREGNAQEEGDTGRGPPEVEDYAAEGKSERARLTLDNRNRKKRRRLRIKERKKESLMGSAPNFKGKPTQRGGSWIIKKNLKWESLVPSGGRGSQNHLK